MMAAIFGAMLLALVLAELRRTLLANAAIALCIVLALWLFQWEIHSPETGYAIPWLRW
ncbi:hypothetical protein [Roseomonas sp. AR75]|uniref:hypothetical protein n=1 Tax=Roseomonas sp. AR75 TaxID=2562311 RepID=UPI001485B4DA|nr:hypothetical protein [Roseomonas sp. AR75]